jgi:hypothetical protein
MNPVRASDYSGILARMAWVFQWLLCAFALVVLPNIKIQREGG